MSLGLYQKILGQIIGEFLVFGRGYLGPREMFAPSPNFKVVPAPLQTDVYIGDHYVTRRDGCPPAITRPPDGRLPPITPLQDEHLQAFTPPLDGLLPTSVYRRQAIIPSPDSHRRRQSFEVRGGGNVKPVSTYPLSKTESHRIWSTIFWRRGPKFTLKNK